VLVLTNKQQINNTQKLKTKQTTLSYENAQNTHKPKPKKPKPTVRTELLV